MSKFSTKKQNASIKALNEAKDQKVINYQGGTGYLSGPELELYQLACTSFLTDNFYESGSEQVKRAKELVSKCSREYVLKLANYARNVMHLRSVSVLLLVLASMQQSTSKENKRLVRLYTPKIVQRADELVEVFACYLFLNGSKKNMPNALRKGLADSFGKFNEYQLAKYKSSKKNVTLRDVIRIARPKPVDSEQATLFGKVVSGQLATPDTWETYISANGSNAKSWNHIAPKMGYMAQLRNLNNFIKTGADEALNTALKNLGDKEQVLKSKQLPFRFLNAFDAVAGHSKAQNVLRDALEHSISNVKALSGKTAVFIDVSGSMSGNRLKTATLLGSMVHKTSEDTDLYVFSTRVEKVSTVSNRDSLLSNVSHVVNRYNHCGGTDHTEIVRSLAKVGQKYDRVIIVTDEQTSDHHFGSTWAKEKSKFGNPKLYIIDVSGYKTGLLPQTMPQTWKIAGLNEQVLSFIDNVENGSNAVEYIMKNY